MVGKSGTKKVIVHPRIKYIYLTSGFFTF